MAAGISSQCIDLACALAEQLRLWAMNQFENGA
jgi:hypothetical protein